MTLRAIEPEQHTAAKVAGFLYLFLMVTAVFAGFYARGPLIVPRASRTGRVGNLRVMVVAIVTLAIMVFPTLAAVLIPAYFAPIAIFEVTLGFWLLIKGIQAPVQ